MKTNLYKKTWSTEEKNELVNYIDTQKAKRPGDTMKKIIADYLKDHNMEGQVTDSAVRSIYKCAKEEADCSNNSIVYKKGTWTYSEDKKIMDFFLDNLGKIKTDQMFKELSKALNRNPKSMKAHFYSTICKNPLNADFVKKVRKFKITPKEDSSKEKTIDPYSFDTLREMPIEKLIAIHTLSKSVLDMHRQIKALNELYNL